MWDIFAVRLLLGDEISRPGALGCCLARCCLILIAVLASSSPRPTSAATYEFEGAYAIRVLAQGRVLEISGTFSWALPQQVGLALAEAPNVRAVYLDSPGGHIKAALEVADLITVHNLDTYVPHMCASACTIAFLAGHQRTISQTAQLGFHQAHGPTLSNEQSNLLLKQVYQAYSLPAAFVAHILRTPPQSLWIPNFAELRKAGIITAIAPDDAAVPASVPDHELIGSGATSRPND